MNMRRGTSVRRRTTRRLPADLTPPASFTTEWAQASFDRFERIASGDAIGPASLRSAGVSKSRIRKLYPLSAATFTPSFMQLIEEPANFTAVRRAMHPLRTTRENDLESAEQYHWALYYYSSKSRFITGADLMPPKEEAAQLAERMQELHGDKHNSLAKLTLLSRTLQMIPLLLDSSQEPIVAADDMGELHLKGVEQRPYQYMRGRGTLSFATLHTATEALLGLLEAHVAQPTVSLKAEK